MMEEDVKNLNVDIIGSLQDGSSPEVNSPYLKGGAQIH